MFDLSRVVFSKKNVFVAWNILIITAKINYYSKIVEHLDREVQDLCNLQKTIKTSINKDNFEIKLQQLKKIGVLLSEANGRKTNLVLYIEEKKKCVA